MAYGWLVGMGAAQPMTDNPYPETGITEETRQMYPENYSDKYNKVFKQFVDDILTVKPVAPIDRLDDHSILLDELVLMYDAHMTIGGEQNRFNASVIRAAINVIKSIQ
jgi:hypothetical protein